MYNRRQSGAALSLVAAATLILVMLGTCFFILSLHMGGSRELLHATDSGSLNVAHQAIVKPDVNLQPTEEALNFSGLTNNGEVCLRNYNRVVGQTLLVALNAQAEGTPAAMANAEKLIDVVEGPQGVGAKLRDALSKAENLEQHFTALSLVNSVRMLGNSAEAQADNDKHQVAYLEEGSASNVSMLPSTLPYSPASMTRVSLPAGSTVTEQSKNFIAGYAPIQIPGLRKTITGVPVMPFKAPHLVSIKDFDAKPTPPKGAGNIPPNSFKSGGKALSSRGIACSIVGALDKNFTASIPHGYLKIHNGLAEKLDDARLGGNDHIFAQELNTGIFVGPGSGSDRAFTADSALYQQWLNYNTAKAAGTAVGPEPSRVGLYGNPYSIVSADTKVTFYDYGDTVTPTAQAMLPKFQQAFPHKNEVTVQSFPSLTALELFKAQVIVAFGKVTRLHDPTDPAFQQHIPAPSIVTGMKIFDKSAPTGNVVSFGRAGSLREFLQQCNASSVLTQIEQRMCQIKPDSTQQERDAVLDKVCIGMGQDLYIYKDGDKLTISANAPVWVNDVKADGRPQNVFNQYDVIKKIVDAAGDGGAPVYPFMDAEPAAAIDRVIYTPSSGYRNLLGEMSFSNSTIGGGWFKDPN